MVTTPCLRIACILLLLPIVLGLCACSAPSSSVEETTVTETDAPETDDMTTKQEVNSDPMEPIRPIQKAQKQASVLYLIGEPAAFSDKLTLATLQGLVANCSEEQILIPMGAYGNYHAYLTDSWGCTIQTQVDGKEITLESLLAHYKDLLSGYLLTSADSASEAGSVAVSLAGLLNAVVVTPENQALCDAMGMPCLMDTTDKDDAWLRSSEYWEQLSREIAVEQPLRMAPKLVDYAVMSKAYFTFYDGTLAVSHQSRFKFLEDNGVVIGWNNTLGEYATVQSLSEVNLQLIPADHAYNLSTLSGFPLQSIQQKTEAVSGDSEKNVHTVCFVISDGDNLQWLMNDFSTSEKWWSNGNRGDFCVGWGLPPTAIDLVAPMTSYLYDSMTERDEFIMQLSGLGYTFPSKWSAKARRTMAEQLSEYMARSGLRYAEILDDNGMNETKLSAFTEQSGIDGIFYIDYSNYAGMNGRILWSNGKPVVAARYRLWAGLADGSIKGIANKINKGSTDPASADSYSFVIVHAWSGLTDGKLSSGGNTMDGVAELISLLNENVEVVTPSEFMNRILANQAK